MKRQGAVSDDDQASTATASSTGGTTSLSPRQGVATSPPPNTGSSSIDLATLMDTSERNSRRMSEDLDIWARAYKILQDREPELVEDYKKHLASLQGDKSSKHLSVETMVSRLVHDRGKKQLRVSLLGKDIVIRQQVERLAKFLLWSDALVQAAVSSQPYAALAWSGAFLFLSLLTSATSMNASMLKGFNSLCDVQVYWEIVEKTYLQPSRRQAYQHLIEPMAKLYSHIIEYQARVICHLFRAQLSRACENVAGWNDWDGKLADIQNLSEQYSGYISPLEAQEVRKSRDMELQKMEESQAILDEIRTILETDRKERQMIEDSEKAGRLLQDLASNYETYKDYNPPRVQGTCEWFFTDERFLEWRASDFGLLWVSAGPGCGKSVLCRALIDEQRLSANVATSAVCYFFFKDGDKHRMYATNALSAILHQLFMNSSSAGDLIQHGIARHRYHGQSLTRNFLELWRILMRCAESPNAGEIVCVLDGLDECHPRSRKQLIEKLEEFYAQPMQRSDSKVRLKFLITSRPHDGLEKPFGALSDTIAHVRIDGDEKAAQISKEVNLVIDAKMDDGIASYLWKDDRRRIAERLKSMEHRTYLWLHLTFKTIEQELGKYYKLSDMETILSDIPSQVSEAYEKILNRSEHKHETETLLQIVLAAKRPLTLDEANIALTMALKSERFDSHSALKSNMCPRKSFKDTVRCLCGLLIGVYDSKLLFIHQTAREFLIHRERRGNWQGRFNLTRAHGKMALICLEYLSYLDEEQSVWDIREDCPLAEYSSEYWTDHVKVAETEEDVQEGVLNFFLEQKQAYAVWGELLRDQSERMAIGSEMAPPLYYASATGLVRIADLLLKSGADANAQGGYYGSALQAGSYDGNMELVQLLLDKGADVNAQGGYFGNALQAASYRGDEELVELLLKRGADVNAQGGKYGTALQAASSEGHIELVQLLLERGANVNAQGGEYGNALQAASLVGCKELVELLLDRGADVNAQGGEYGNALRAAEIVGNDEVVKLLLERGANANAHGGH